jgi:competence protein ComEA
MKLWQILWLIGSSYLLVLPAVGVADGVRVSPAEQTIHLNQAEADEIAEVFNGIGQKRAQAIVDYREQHGPFTDIQQLASVDGISQQFVARNAQALSQVFLLE